MPTFCLALRHTLVTYLDQDRLDVIQMHRCLYLSTFSATQFTESSESEALGEYECCFLEMTMYLHLWALNCRYYSQSRWRLYHCQIVGLDSLLMLLYYQQNLLLISSR